jgi:hypothetical protein
LASVVARGRSSRRLLDGAVLGERARAASESGHSLVRDAVPWKAAGVVATVAALRIEQVSRCA